jgi:sec-independent protein translocase protein TatA
MLNTVMAEIGGQTLIIVAIVVVLIFGGKKIPELMHGLGKGIRNFKEGMNGTDDEKKDGSKENEKLKQ